MGTCWEKKTLRGFPSSLLFTSLCTSQGNPYFALIETEFHEKYFKDLTFTFNEEMAWSRFQRVAWHNLTKSWERELMTTCGSSKTWKYFWPMEHIFCFYILNLAKSQEREWRTTCNKAANFFTIAEYVFIGPESDHWVCLSLTHSLTNWLTAV